MSFIFPEDNSFLDRLAHDTWSYLSSEWATDNHLPWSWRSANPFIPGGDYVNPAEIGFYALAWLGAYELRQPWSPTWTRVEIELVAILDRLRAWQTGSQSYQPHGPNAYCNSVFYQWYWINWNPPIVGDKLRKNQLVPSVDNAWLAASLVMIREYSRENNRPRLAEKAQAILNDMDFSIWYSCSTHRFWWGAVQKPQGDTEADYYSNENRIINFVGRALENLEPAEFRLSLDALVVKPGVYQDITVEKVAWDGSLFTYLAPALFIREIHTDYGKNTLLPVIEAQIAYAQAQGYPAWGFSDCYDIGVDGYVKQGAPPTASPDSPETHPGLITPYASAFALMTPLAAQAINNLQTLIDRFPAVYEAKRGFRDSIMTRTDHPKYGLPSARFSALAQAWIFLSIVNARTELIWNYFYQAQGVAQAHLEMYGEPY